MSLGLVSRVSEAKLGSCDLHKGGGAFLASLCTLNSSALHCSYHLSSEGGALGLRHAHMLCCYWTQNEDALSVCVYRWV